VDRIYKFTRDPWPQNTAQEAIAAFDRFEAEALPVVDSSERRQVSTIKHLVGGYDAKARYLTVPGFTFTCGVCAWGVKRTGNEASSLCDFDPHQ
jgi:hypothetical protein